MVVIHGKRLQSIDFVMSILPQTAFTWWVNNNIGQKILQKHETIGFKEYVRKSTSRIQGIFSKNSIDVVNKT